MKPSGGIARCPRCPPGLANADGCLFRCLSRRLSDYRLCRQSMLFFGVCCAIIPFFFSLLKRKKEVKKEKLSPTLVSHGNASHERQHDFRYAQHKSPGGGNRRLVRRNIALFSPFYWGVRLSGGSPSLGESAVAISAGRRAEPAALLKRKKEAKKEKLSPTLVLHGNAPHERQRYFRYAQHKLPGGGNRRLAILGRVCRRHFRWATG